MHTLHQPLDRVRLIAGRRVWTRKLERTSWKRIQVSTVHGEINHVQGVKDR